jgi:hypothetical protein
MMNKITVILVMAGMAAAFALGLIVGGSRVKITYLNDGLEKAVLEISTIPPALPPHLISADINSPSGN